MNRTVLIPSRDDMKKIVGDMPENVKLATFCRFIDSTQLDIEKVSKNTIEKNHVGVSKVHAARCAELLDRVKRGEKVWRSDIEYAMKILVHYRRQLIEMGLIR